MNESLVCTLALPRVTKNTKWHYIIDVESVWLYPFETMCILCNIICIHINVSDEFYPKPL